MFNKITIVGCGLIGSSILRAAIKKKVSKTIHAYDKSKETVSFLKNMKFDENIETDLSIAVKNTDLIIIAAPLSSYKEILLSIKDHINHETILTDTGSVKKEVNKIVQGFNLKNISWVASHPIAGTEESGPAAGFADLFQNRWCIISPGENAKKENIEKVKKFWELIGCKTKIMSFNDHDYILSLTSHLPHAIAYNIVKSAVESKEKLLSSPFIRSSTRGMNTLPLSFKSLSNIII